MKPGSRDFDSKTQAGADGVHNIMLALTIVLAILNLCPTASAQMIAHVDKPIPNPTYINIYWDTFWDFEHPTMPKANIDSMTQAITGSTYFAGLTEYGVKSASFAGGFLPDPACVPKPNYQVGFWAPGDNTTIAAFIDCEHQRGPAAIFQRAGVIYNIILPASAMESDFWSANFCSGPGSATGWHYHGLQSSAFGGAPPFTITLANPRCLDVPNLPGLFESLTHEMVEAATDPYPFDVSIIPPYVGASTENEIADLCNDASMPFGDVLVSEYWSNSQQRCVSGPPAGIMPTWESLGGMMMGKVTAVSSGSGRLDLFVRGADNSILHKYFDGTNWQPSLFGWESLGGATTGDISAVSWGPGRLDLFIRGSDSNVYHKYLNGTVWGPSMTTWEPIGGPVAGEVSAVSWGPGRLDIFETRMGDNAILHKFFDGGQWGPSAGWESLGGATTGKVSAVSWGFGRLDLFVRGTDNAVYHKYYDRAWGPSTLGWDAPVGGASLSDVAVLSTGLGLLDMFVRGTDDVIYHASYNGNWNRWVPLGGMTAFDVSAISSTPGQLDVFVRGTDNLVYHASSSPSGWAPWSSLGGVGTIGPVAAVASGSGRMDLFARGLDDTVRHRYFDGVAWKP